MRKIIGLILLLCISSAFASKTQYAIVVDAGSSGSRLHLFAYQTGKLPVIEEIFSEKTSPGLSSFEKNPEQAASSLKKLFVDANNQLLLKHVDTKNVTISILGTAGMRLLSSEAQQAIYSNVKQYINNHYAFTSVKTETISGKMEGVYGWLDINYLAGNFNTNKDMTVGSIDMGGASMQTVYSSREANSDDSLELTIGSHHYTIVSKSFLGLGLDQARSTINQNSVANTCYPTNYPISESSKGNFNLASCKELYLSLLNQHEIAKKLAPFAKQSFIAYSGIYYVNHFLGTENKPDQANVEKRIQTICTQSWEQLKAAYTNEKYLDKHCANAVYSAALLYDTYQLDGRQLMVTNQINGKEIDWTLGAVLFESIVMPAKAGIHMDGSLLSQG